MPDDEKFFFAKMGKGLVKGTQEINYIPPPSPVIVNSRGVSSDFRVSCVLHHSLAADEPLWIMIPIDKDLADELDHVTLVTKDGDCFSTDVRSLSNE